MSHNTMEMYFKKYKQLFESDSGSDQLIKHHMTAQERKAKKALCQLLIDKGHRKYAERFWQLDFNIVNSKKFPKFTAAVSFDDATVFISDGFLGSGEGIFNQLDVLLRHELAHNLMMHQIRMLAIFKKRYVKLADDDPEFEEYYEGMSTSSSIHGLLNIIEDFEISNKRYSNVDKDIVRHMQLNGELIGGLITEENRAWASMSLENMYQELEEEIKIINNSIRSDPNWQPKTHRSSVSGNQLLDPIDSSTAEAVVTYFDAETPSSIRGTIDKFISSETFAKFAPRFKKLVNGIYEEFKQLDLNDDTIKQDIIRQIGEIAATDILTSYAVKSPATGQVVVRLISPEDKMLAQEVLKKLAGIKKPVQKIVVKRAQHSQEYIDAWNKTIAELDNGAITTEDLLDIMRSLEV